MSQRAGRKGLAGNDKLDNSPVRPTRSRSELYFQNLDSCLDDEDSDLSNTPTRQIKTKTPVKSTSTIDLTSPAPKRGESPGPVSASEDEPTPVKRKSKRKNIVCSEVDEDDGDDEEVQIVASTSSPAGKFAAVVTPSKLARIPKKARIASPVAISAPPVRLLVLHVFYFPGVIFVSNRPLALVKPSD
jgi:hypothetical protein